MNKLFDGESKALQSFLLQETKVLSSSKFQGRYPGTIGEGYTLKYIKSLFSKEYFDISLQSVPLKQYHVQEKQLRINNENVSLPEDAIVLGANEFSSIKSSIIFVGFGIIAPEYNWNDYENIDVTGKCVICLANDPGNYHPKLFKGSEMTYYGHWQYKYEEAYRQGATAVFIIHDEKTVGYPWSTLQSITEVPQLMLEGQKMPNVYGWLNSESFEKLNYYPIASWIKRGLSQRTSTLGCINCFVHNKKNIIKSENLIVDLKTSNPDPNSQLLYTTNWSNLGVDYNSGARNNALSIASLCALAKLLQQCQIENLELLANKNIRFVFFTGKERLGSTYYASQLSKEELENIACVINIENMNIFGPTQDLSFLGNQLYNNAYRKIIEDSLLEQERLLTPDPQPELFYMSEAWPFVARDVPTLTPQMGFMGAQDQSYLSLNRDWYHECFAKPADIVYTQGPYKWNLAGVQQDLEFIFALGIKFC